MSSQILDYINKFDINRKLLAQATDVIYFVSNLWQMHKKAWSLYINPYFYLFVIHFQ